MLGHLRANNQRSGKNLSLIRNFKGGKFNHFQYFEKEKTPACSASVCGSVSIFYCGDVGRVVENGCTNPLVTMRPRWSGRRTTEWNRSLHLRSGLCGKSDFCELVGTLIYPERFTMPTINQVQDYQQLCKDRNNDRILTPGGLWLICARINDLETIGNHIRKTLPQILKKGRHH